MSLLYDDAGLAAVVLTRIAAEESEGPSEMTGRMSEYIADLVERNGPTAATELSIALARQHFIALDTLARELNVSAGQLLDALEVELLESLDDGN
ncbi:hypothetical protein [Arthrobacter sp. BE255]|uniref:hypothetical protein n=1 Tax=Arthrobacter sp. BE255 TaxID=2817721 RepID=UPI00285728E5|nr:hypothetical protein [Arthrobacter sp. BE255]MDR7161774.1 hypothetical protein [Arthrobacter sp. BE255]